MASKILHLHGQNLVDAMLHLEHCNDPRAQLAFDMAKRGDLHPLNEVDLAPLRSRKQAVFDEDIFNSPWLSGQENLPFDSLPTASQTQQALIADIGGTNSYRFAPSHSSHELDAHATIKLLSSIQDPLFDERGAIIHMASPTFDHLRTKTMPWARDGILGQSNFQITIAPANEVFDIEFSPHCYFSTLLLGRQVWVAYPPRHGNLSTLQRQYESLVGYKSGPVFRPIVKKLKHGIIITQEAGQTLMLPPFWSYLIICTETCTSASYHLATALKFTDRLLNIGLQVSAFLMWPEKTQQQLELIKYLESLATHLDRIFNSSFAGTGFKPEPIMKQICSIWDKAPLRAPKQVTLKEQICQLCKRIEDPGQRRRIERIWQRGWLVFLITKTKKPECQICHMKVSDMSGYGLQGLDGAEDIMLVHFVASHWVAGAQEN